VPIGIPNLTGEKTKKQRKTKKDQKQRKKKKKTWPKSHSTECFHRFCKAKLVTSKGFIFLKQQVLQKQAAQVTHSCSKLLPAHILQDRTCTFGRRGITERLGIQIRVPGSWLRRSLSGALGGSSLPPLPWFPLRSDGDGYPIYLKHGNQGVQRSPGHTDTGSR